MRTHTKLWLLAFVLLLGGAGVLVAEAAGQLSLDAVPPFDRPGLGRMSPGRIGVLLAPGLLVGLVAGVLHAKHSRIEKLKEIAAVKGRVVRDEVGDRSLRERLEERKVKEEARRAEWKERDRKDQERQKY